MPDMTAANRRSAFGGESMADIRRLFFFIPLILLILSKTIFMNRDHKGGK
jgi:hypothetical protein